MKMDDQTLRALGEKGRMRKEEEDAAEVRLLRDKYHVS